MFRKCNKFLWNRFKWLQALPSFRDLNGSKLKTSEYKYVFFIILNNLKLSFKKNVCQYRLLVKYFVLITTLI